MMEVLAKTSIINARPGVLAFIYVGNCLQGLVDGTFVSLILVVVSPKE